MSLGSNLDALITNKKPHLLKNKNGGMSTLLAQLYDVLDGLFAPMAAITVQEYTNVAAAVTNGLLAATTCSVAVQVKTASGLLAGGKTALLACPRNITFTTAGDTPADAPATATIVGTDIYNQAQTEVVNVGQTATTVAGTKAFKTVKSITYSAGQGTDATVAIGFGNVLGLLKTPKVRAGLAAIVKEVVGGSVVTNGVLDATNKTYAPNSAPNGTLDYAIYFEYDPQV